MTLLTNIISGITAFLLLYFAIFLLVTKRGIKLNKLILSSFLFSNSIYILSFLFLNIQELRSYSGLYILSIGYSFGYLFGPLLFFYTKSLVRKSFSISGKKIWHLIPFVIAFLFKIMEIFFLGKKLYLIFEVEIDPYYFIMNIQILLYMVFCLKILKNYLSEIKEHYSEIDKKNLSWLSTIVLAFFFMWLIDFVGYLVIISIPEKLFLMTYLTFISLLINFVFANYIIYKGLENPELYSGIEFEGYKYNKSALSESEKENIAEKIIDLVDKQKAYLNPSLTLNNISDSIQTNPKYISQVINEVLGKNFFDLVNSYRIEHAKKLIAADKNNSTILQILYESGFNSKSAFNTVFKKFTGITPTQYKNSS